MDPKKPNVQQELFEANLLDWPVKDDLHSMELPLFALTRQKDIQIREYERNGTRVKIIPSASGAATQHDKDLLIYAVSQLVEGRNRGQSQSRRILINAHDFLVGTQRGTGGKNYQDLLDMLRRLRGTTIETNVRTGGSEQTKGFGLIEDYDVTRYTKSGSGVLECWITLSEWLYNAVASYEVLTLSRDYFLLDKPIERRLYEIARKHVGEQAYFKINEELLKDKVGSRRSQRQFRSELRQIMEADTMPDFRIAIDPNCKPMMVVFYTRNSKRLFQGLVSNKAFSWWESLEKFKAPTELPANEKQSDLNFGESAC
jgi:plasmid replication initiation protein